MAKSPETLYRHWRILELIPAHPAAVTAPELWSRLRDEGFGCTKRTIERDLEILSARQPLVADDRAKPFRWSYAQQAAQRVVPGLTPAQAVALALARDHLAELLPKPLADSLAGFYRSADAVIEDLGWKRWVDATAFVSPAQRLIPAPYRPEVLFAIQEAIAGDRQLAILYRKKWDATAADRIVQPLGVLFGGPVSYLVATDRDADLPKHFALHRIDAASIEDGRRRVPKGFRMKRYARSPEALWMHEPGVKLVLWIDPPAAEHLRETPLSEDQTWRRLEEPDVVEVTATVDDTEQLRWWIRSFGDQIRVVSPSGVDRSVQAASAEKMSATKGSEP